MAELPPAYQFSSSESQGERNPTTPMGDPRWWKNVHAISSLGSGPCLFVGVQCMYMTVHECALECISNDPSARF